MSTQIAVRLPDQVVAFLDREVSEKRAPSRAAVVLRALEREQRRQIAARNAAILPPPNPTTTSMHLPNTPQNWLSTSIDVADPPCSSR